MAKLLKWMAALLGLAALCLPLAGIATILMMPLWSWIEARFGIESVGHSGPADWCFELTYAVLLLAALGLWRRMARRQSGLEQPRDAC